MTVPRLALNDGNRIPQIGLGVWRIADHRAPEVIRHALRAGYRHIDTAHAYHNEEGVGTAVQDSGLPRDDIFVTSKLWNTCHGRDRALRAFDGTMARLGLDHLDLYLIHWPVPAEDRYVETWRALIELQASGRVRSIGVSNFTEEHLRRIVDETGVVPCVNQIELHPRFQQRAAREPQDRLGVRIESWSPLGQGRLMQDAELLRIAEKHGVTVGQVILRWHVQQDLVVIPRSQTPEHIVGNLDVFGFALDEQDLTSIAALDSGEGRIGPVPDEMGPVDLPPTRRAT